MHTLFAEIGPFYADRDGGYTRIIKTVPPQGRQRADGNHRARQGEDRHLRGRPRSSREGSKDAPAAAPAEENVVEAVEAEATDAEVENADAVVEAIEDETATAADAPPEAEEAKKD